MDRIIGETTGVDGLRVYRVQRRDGSVKEFTPMALSSVYKYAAGIMVGDYILGARPAPVVPVVSYISGKIEAYDPATGRYRINHAWHRKNEISPDSIRQFNDIAKPIWLAVGLEGDNRRVCVTYNKADHEGLRDTVELLVADPLEYRRKIVERLERIGKKITQTQIHIPHGVAMDRAIEEFTR